MATAPIAAAGVSSGASALQGLARLAPWRQVILLAALAGSITVGVAGALLLQREGFVPLGGNVRLADVSELSTALERAGIPYRIEDGGMILVAADKQGEAKLALAETGLAVGIGEGLDEFLKKDPGIGTSQLIQMSRLKRGLEVELARTITAMKPIASARVHLAMPRESAFLRNRNKPSASVLVELRSGRTLADDQVETIRHLVSQSVPNLQPGDVAVTDARGRLLGPIGNDVMAVRQQRLDYVRRVEAEKLEKIVGMLTRLTGRDGFTAEVSANVDFTEVETATQTWNPDLPAPRSRTLSEETAGAGGIGGVPGALSNQPAAVASAPQQAQEGAAAREPEAGPSTRLRRTETVNNELDRQISHRVQATGSLTQLSVAVVLDDQRLAGADGSITRRSWTPEELNRIESLVKSAIGFSFERGDVVSVTNSRFAPLPEVEAIPALPIWEEPWVWDVARQLGIGILALGLVLGVFRPVMRNLVSREIVEREAEQAGERARLEAEQQVRNAELAPNRSPALEGPSEYERRLETVRGLIADDPRRAANVMKEWVGQNG